MHKVLLVNNDLDLLSLLKTWLERKDYEVWVTTSHRKVLALIMRFNPDLVLADVLQLQAVQMIKENVATMYIPVLLMSGYSGRLKNEKFPADDFIEKPFDLPLLEVKMQQLLKKAALTHL